MADKPDRQTLVEEYERSSVERNNKLGTRPTRSIKRVADKYGVSYSTMRNWFVEYGIKTNTVRLDDSKRDKAVEMYNAGEQITRIAEFLDVSRRTIYTWLKNQGVEFKAQSVSQDDKKRARIDYLEGKPVIDIAESCGVSRQAVYAWVKEWTNDGN